MTSEAPGPVENMVVAEAIMAALSHGKTYVEAARAGQAACETPNGKHMVAGAVVIYSAEQGFVDTPVEDIVSLMDADGNVVAMASAAMLRLALRELSGK